MARNSRTDFSGKILQSRRVGDFQLMAVSYAPNQILNRHSHQQAYVSVAFDGAYLEERQTGTWECSAGGTIFHEPGECHSNRFSDFGARLLVLELPPAFLASIADRGIRTDRQYAFTSPVCMHLAGRLARAIQLRDPLSALCAEGLSLELLSEALRPRDSAESKAPDWLGRVGEILRDRYPERITLSELAAEVNVHPVHLARAFRKRYRCCVGDFLRRLRVDAACQQLIKSELTIAQIAAQTGFADQSHLSRVLKRYTGVSPAALRNSRASE